MVCKWCVDLTSYVFYKKKYGVSIMCRFDFSHYLYEKNKKWWVLNEVWIWQKKILGFQWCVDLSSYNFYVKEKKIMGFQRCVDLTSYVFNIKEREIIGFQWCVDLTSYDFYIKEKKSWGFNDVWIWLLMFSI